MAADGQLPHRRRGLFFLFPMKARGAAIGGRRGRRAAAAGRNFPPAPPPAAAPRPIAGAARPPRRAARRGRAPTPARRMWRQAAPARPRLGLGSGIATALPARALRHRHRVYRAGGPGATDERGRGGRRPARRREQVALSPGQSVRAGPASSGPLRLGRRLLLPRSLSLL